MFFRKYILNQTIFAQLIVILFFTLNYILKLNERTLWFLTFQTGYQLVIVRKTNNDQYGENYCDQIFGHIDQPYFKW